MGNVAAQQALVCYLGLSYRMAAAIAGVHHRTVWQHVKARRGSNVKTWDTRSQTEQEQALRLAQTWINAYVLRNR